MAEVNLLTQACETIEAVERWHARTKPEYRTLDNLKSYLERNGKFFSFPLRKERKFWGELRGGKEAREMMSLRMLAQLLEVKGLSFKLTPALVDAIVRPRMHDIEWGGYQFFLEHYHEHPFLEELIRRSISGGGLRLRVNPVIPVDGNLMTWLFNPWEMKVYQLSQNNGTNTDIRIRQEGGRLISVAMHSICEEYRGSHHPFSKQYIKRVKEAKQVVSN